jgi:hypothetical protein
MSKPRTLPCTRDDILDAIIELWPKVTAARGVDAREYGPILDGHAAIGFSVRLFGPPTSEPNDETRAAYAALEDLLRGLEDAGFDVARDGNEHQPGRLVLGWSAFRRAYDTVLVRFRDASELHPASIERRDRLARERAAKTGTNYS